MFEIITKKTKAQKRCSDFNRVSEVIRNPKNNGFHLPAIKKMVNDFISLHGNSVLSELLTIKYNKLETKWN